MNKIKDNKDKVTLLGILAIILIVALTVIVLNISGDVHSSDDADTTNNTVETESVETTIPEITTTTVITTTTETTITEPDETTIVTSEATTTTVLTTMVETKPETIATTTEAPIITLAPVETPSESVMQIIVENNIDIVETAPVVQTTPAPAEQKSPSSTTYIDGQKHVWHPVLGWCADYGEGTVVIMDVEDKGDRAQYEGGW